MRWFHGVLASFLFAVLLVACNTVDPSECWPNTSGGFGGGGTIPIGAGVGATSSGDFITPPPHDPLDHGGAPDNPSSRTSPPASRTRAAGAQPVARPFAELLCRGAHRPTRRLMGERPPGSVTDACLSKCPAPGGGLFVKFYPADFPFVTTVKDDGTGKAGGWRVAKVNLEFTRAVIPMSIVTWWCLFHLIGMPLRTTKKPRERSSASRAADSA